MLNVKMIDKKGHIVTYYVDLFSDIFIKCLILLIIKIHEKLASNLRMIDINRYRKQIDIVRDKNVIYCYKKN
jgi:hypothetical protein